MSYYSVHSVCTLHLPLCTPCTLQTPSPDLPTKPGTAPVESKPARSGTEKVWNMSKPAQIHANYIEFSFHCYTQSFKFCHDSRAKQLVMSHVQNQTWDCLQMLQAKHSWSMLVATSSVCEVAFKCMWATFWKFPAFKCISSWEQRYSVLKKDIQNRTNETNSENIWKWSSRFFGRHQSPRDSPPTSRQCAIGPPALCRSTRPSETKGRQSRMWSNVSSSKTNKNDNNLTNIYKNKRTKANQKHIILVQSAVLVESEFSSQLKVRMRDGEVFCLCRLLQRESSFKPCCNPIKYLVDSCTCK